MNDLILSSPRIFRSEGENGFLIVWVHEATMQMLVFEILN